MPHPSTFSIAACDLSDQSWGVAVASKFPAVGAVVPWASAGAGAVATQAHGNTTFGPRGLELMRSGLGAEETLHQLLGDDPDREKRQVGMVDARGKSATYTGSSCYPWAGGITGEGYAIQGNILAGEQVVKAMKAAFISPSQGDLPDRLYAALLAGDLAGGDRRGRQSAAILVVKPGGGYSGFNDRWIDYRVDDHTDPVARLGELLEMHRLYFGHSPESERITLDGQELMRFQAMLRRLGYYSGPQSGIYDPATRAAFESFIGNENFEDRVDPQKGVIDRPVLEFLYRRFEENR
ncbi:MAG TPA: DUF1028 domain-containing protein [Anaerolineales bacterium]